MGRVFLAAMAGVWLAACATPATELLGDEANILATWEQFETYYNAGDIEGVKSLLFIEALEEEEQERLQAETAAMASSSNWMMSPNVGMTLDADVKVRSVDGDSAILDGTLKQVTGQSVFFSMNLTRVDGAWLLAPG